MAPLCGEVSYQTTPLDSGPLCGQATYQRAPPRGSRWEALYCYLVCILKLRHSCSFQVDSYVDWQYRAESRFSLSQWETALLCNDVSHWLGANLESGLHYMFFPPPTFHWIFYEVLKYSWWPVQPYIMTRKSLERTGPLCGESFCLVVVSLYTGSVMQSWDANFLR